VREGAQTLAAHARHPVALLIVAARDRTPRRRNSTTSTGGLNMTDNLTAANKALVQRFYKDVYVDWNMAAADAVVSPRFVSHDWPADGPRGPKAFRDYYSAIRAAVPDATYEVDDVVAEGDRVVVRWRLLGTHRGEFRGIAPSGRPITLKGIAIYRVEGGKLMERWVVSDLHGALQGSSIQ
jgi:predicted ester cyclase